MRSGGFIRPNPNTAVGRVQATKRVAQVTDLAADAAYLEREPLRSHSSKWPERTRLSVSQC